MISWKYFKMHQKLWKVIRRMYVVEFPCKKLLQLQEYSLQATTAVKIARQIHSGSAQKRNNVLKFCKLQKIFGKLSHFLLHYSPAVQNIWISEKIFFQMLEKLLLRIFWKIIRKMSAVAFLLKKLNCPIHPMRKLTSLQIFPLYASRIWKLAVVESYLSKVTETFGFCRGI